MIRKASDMHTDVRENMKGGEGEVRLTPIFEQGDYQSDFSMIGRIVLAPGACLGLHTHLGEEELLTVLSGLAAYTDADGKVYPMNAGDACLCRNGESHQLKNASLDDELVCFTVISTLHS